jgi:hypothetical protein
MTKIQKGIKIAEYLPDDFKMVEGVAAAPLHTNQYEVNAKITEFLKGKEYLKDMLVKKLTS